MNGWQYWSFEHETIAERLERLLKDADLTDTVNEKLVVKVHNFKRQLAGQIGRSLVIAELVRRNIVPTAFAGHVPDIDLLAHANNTTLQLQIKIYYKGSINFNLYTTCILILTVTDK